MCKLIKKQRPELGTLNEVNVRLYKKLWPSCVITKREEKTTFEKKKEGEKGGAQSLDTWT